MEAGQGVTQSRFNTASRLAAATAILVGGGLSIANPVDGTVNTSAAGVAPAQVAVTGTPPVEKGRGLDSHGPRGHQHEVEVKDRGHDGGHRGEKGRHATNHEGMNHDGMGHDGTPNKRMDHRGMDHKKTVHTGMRHKGMGAHEGMDHERSPDRETHRQKSH